MAPLYYTDPRVEPDCDVEQAERERALQQRAEDAFDQRPEAEVRAERTARVYRQTAERRMLHLLGAPRCVECGQPIETLDEADVTSIRAGELPELIHKSKRPGECTRPRQSIAVTREITRQSSPADLRKAIRTLFPDAVELPHPITLHAPRD